MDIRVASTDMQVSHSTRRHMDRMLSPLTGLTRSVGFLAHGSGEGHLLTAGAELTGVHQLMGRADPGPGAYHIGGGGLLLGEALVRCFGETAERYAHFVWQPYGAPGLTYTTYNELVACGEQVIAPRKLRFFTDEQHADPELPYGEFAADAPLGWVRLSCLTGGEPCWIPAHALIVGFRRRPDELPLISAVTTGTAAHTDPDQALVNALLEIVQIDAAMGHWYSRARAPRIVLDQRTTAVRDIVDRYFRWAPTPRFYLLACPDLPGFSIACVVRSRAGTPAVGVGLGVGLRLRAALYKALLEATGAVQLAKKGFLDAAGDARRLFHSAATDRIYDLEHNVLFYAVAENSKYLEAKFADDDTVAAGDLPDDEVLAPAEEAARLVDAFAASGKDLYVMDLTPADVAGLGFTVTRAWSPDTISLSLPSAPPLAHAGFHRYGPSDRNMPHPYP